MKNKIYSYLRVILLPFLFAVTVNASDPMVKSSCEPQLSRAVDGRLEPHIVAVLPRTAQRVVGFEIMHDRPLVAFPRMLVGFQSKITELPVTQQITGIAYQKSSNLLLQSDAGFLQLWPKGLEPAIQLNRIVHGRIYGSGNSVFVEVRERRGILQFIARKSDGGAFPIAAIKGRLRVASWNEWGLAAVVDDSLFLWQPGAPSVVRLLTDRGLAGAHDVVAVGERRVVVGLKTNVVLVGQDTITIIAGLPMARCRFHAGVLYVLQESNGVIWEFHGLEKMGGQQEDRNYAEKLLTQGDATKSAPQFHEAARILGCKATIETLKDKASDVSPCSSCSTATNQNTKDRRSLTSIR